MHFSSDCTASLPPLLDMFEGIWLHIGPTLNYLFDDIRFAGRAAITNMPIVDALCSRKGSPAREAVVHNISHAMVWLVQHLPQSDPVASLGQAAR